VIPVDVKGLESRPARRAHAMVRTVRSMSRMLAIARILARHDALFPLETFGVAPVIVLFARLVSRRRAPGRPGERLASALHEAGPSFIKLGQALSTRSDLLGEDLTADLSKLQDRLPPFPGAEARAIIEEELGAPIAAVFQSFDDKPIAAASIAQVHLAVDTDGREVAVKVLRPGIEEAFERDLELFLWGAELIEANIPEWRRFRPVESLQTIVETVQMEMDLRFEAAAAAELAENFVADPEFKVPAVDWSRTARRVLTTERVTGIPIDERQAIIEAGHDPHVVLTRAAESFFRQIFRDGFFHGDLHPGNLFVRADGSIAAVDFGIMGRIDRRTRHFLGEMLLAFLSRDYRRVAEIHFEAGWVPADRSIDTFTQACRSIAEPIMDKPQNEISVASLLGHLFKVTETFGMETQPQLLLLQKTMLVAEGSGRKLCPDVNMWVLARPLIQAWMVDHLGPQARLQDTLAEISQTMVKLPGVIAAAEKTANALSDGRLRLHPESIEMLLNVRSGGATTWIPWLIAAILAIILVLK
jgi:ubiquinone biosynthesis protein